MRIFTFKIRRMQMRIVAIILSVTSRNVVHWIVTICYFLKSIKSVFILVESNISLSKNYVAHSCVTVVCVIGWIWEKMVCLSSLAVSCIWNHSSNNDFSMNSHSTAKRLKHSSNFESGENIRSSNVIEFEFEHRHIPTNVYSCHNYNLP